MAKEGEAGSANHYRLGNYSLSDLLDLAKAAGAQKILLEGSYTPVLFVKGKKIEIDGPDVESEVMEELVRSVANTRQLRLLRENGSVDIIQTIDNFRFLVRVVDAFGVYRLDLIPVRDTG
jgi:Tfp pilus assembly pilus retraction ATPase PilT